VEMMRTMTSRHRHSHSRKLSLKHTIANIPRSHLRPAPKMEHTGFHAHSQGLRLAAPTPLWSARVTQTEGPITNTDITTMSCYSPLRPNVRLWNASKWRNELNRYK
jgi:hypothetical protein